MSKLSGAIGWLIMFSRVSRSKGVKEKIFGSELIISHSEHAYLCIIRLYADKNKQKSVSQFTHSPPEPTPAGLTYCD
jgi:hypothetical protein